MDVFEWIATSTVGFISFYPDKTCLILDIRRSYDGDVYISHLVISEYKIDLEPKGGRKGQYFSLIFGCVAFSSVLFLFIFGCLFLFSFSPSFFLLFFLFLLPLSFLFFFPSFPFSFS